MRLAALWVVLGCGGLVAGQNTANLPDAPSAQKQDQKQRQKQEQKEDQDEEARISASGKLPALLAPQMTRDRLTAGDKFRLYTHQAFNPLALLPPALSAGFNMARPKDGYPHEWKAGGGGIGRLYGDALAQREAEQAASFLAGAALREDPRYLPSTGHGALGRVTHALEFAIVDKSDGGRAVPAFSNFAGAAASGFVGMAYLPRGYDDVTHAGQRSLTTLAGFAASNVLNEFCPEWGPLVQKLHLPFVHPPCPDRMRAKKP